MAIALLTLGLVGLLAVAIIRRVRKSWEYKTSPVWYLIPVGVLVLSLAVATFTLVPTGYTGVVTVAGQISDTALSPGLRVHTPYISSIHLVNNKLQDIEVPDQFWGESKQDTPVYAQDTIVSYTLNASASVYVCKTVSGMDKGIIKPSMVGSSVKAAMTQLDNAFVTKRVHIEPLVVQYLQDNVNDKYGKDVVTIRQVIIQDMDFEPSYNEAIAARSNALMKQEEQAVKNQTAIEEAEATKKVKITEAEAAAEQKRIAAEAEANRIKTEAAAEAEANRVLQESLSETILDYQFYEKWNGVLPKVMGEGTVVTDIND